MVAEREGYYMDRPEMVFGDDADAAHGPASTGRARLRCPKCGVHLIVYRRYAGKVGRCPGCDALLKVPAGAFRHSVDADVQPAETTEDENVPASTATPPGHLRGPGHHGRPDGAIIQVSERRG